MIIRHETYALGGENFRHNIGDIADSGAPRNEPRDRADSQHDEGQWPGMPSLHDVVDSGAALLQMSKK